MSIIASGTTTTTALVQTGNTDGTLQLQVNGTTPSVTLNALGAVGVGSSPSYGTTGQVLTSTGSTSAPSWTTLTVSGSGGATASGNVTLTSASSGAQSVTTTTYGQFVKLPDATTMTKAACVFNVTNAGNYPLKIVNSVGTTKGFLMPGQSSAIGLADNSTAAGVWDITNTQLLGIIGAYSYDTAMTAGNGAALRQIDSDRDLFMFGTTNLYGIVYNRTTQTWGAITLIRSGNCLTQALLIATDKILLVSTVSGGTAFQAVVLSFSGTTISVGTAATATLSFVPTTAGFNNKYSGNNSISFIAVGSSYVVSYASAAALETRAMTVSGTTVTIGSAVSLSGITTPAQLYAVSASVVLALTGSTSTGALYACPITVSGTTLTAGTQATLSGSVGVVYFSSVLGTRWALLDINAGTNIPRGVIVSVSGTTATMNATDFGVSGRSDIAVCMVGSKMLVAWYESGGTSYHVNTMADNAGTPSIATAINKTDNNATTSYALVPTSSTTARLVFIVGSSRQYLWEINTASTNPTMSLVQMAQSSSTPSNFDVPVPIYSRSGGYTVLLTNSATNALPEVTNASMGGQYAGIRVWGASGFQTIAPPNVGGNATFYISGDAKYCASLFTDSGSTVLISYTEMAQ